MTTPMLLPRLDLMIAYSCYIKCVGCISLSDFKRDGIAKFEDIASWLAHWGPLIEPKVLTLFGGEPLLHHKVFDICSLVRSTWPKTIIRLITNGYLLKNFDSEKWFNFKPFEIQVSVHRADHEHIINKNIKDILEKQKDWTVSINNGSGHKKISWESEGFKIYKSHFKEFVVPFKNNIEPWFSDPALSHSICGAPNTPVLYKGKLFKCPAVANAMDLSGKNWFNYQACEDHTTLESFVKNIGRPETVCGQCPDRTQAIVIDHFDKNNVIVKQKNLS